MSDVPPTTCAGSSPEPSEDVYILPDSAVHNEKREYHWSLRRPQRTRRYDPQPADSSNHQTAP